MQRHLCLTAGLRDHLGEARLSGRWEYLHLVYLRIYLLLITRLKPFGLPLNILVRLEIAPRIRGGFGRWKASISQEAHVHCNLFLPMLVAFPAENTKKGLKAATPLMDLCPLPSRFYIVKCGVARPTVWHSCIPGTSVTQSWVFECVTLGCLANVKGSTQVANRFPFEYNIPVINLPRAEFPAFP